MAFVDSARFDTEPRSSTGKSSRNDSLRCSVCKIRVQMLLPVIFTSFRASSSENVGALVRSPRSSQFSLSSELVVLIR